MTEQEYKWLVPPEKFEEIINILRSRKIPEEIIIQKNHYYASPDEVNNVGRTIRVREIANTYTLQIKEDKEKREGYRISQETHRDLPYIPVQFSSQELGFPDENPQVFDYSGFLVTTRHRFQFDEYNQIDCDINQFVHQMDFEIELEFLNTPPLTILGLFNGLKTNSVSKYERFIHAQRNDTDEDLRFTEKIRNILFQILNNQEVFTLSVNAPLTQCGLDSLNMVQIVVFLEEEFEFEMPDFLLDFTVFETIEKILKLVKICLLEKESRCIQ